MRLFIVLKDQLHRRTFPADSILMLCELKEEATHIRHHPQKVIFWFSAMRHAAEEWRSQGYTVRYVACDDPHNTHQWHSEIERARRELGIQDVCMMAPSEWHLRQQMEQLGVTLWPEDQFLCDTPSFEAWAKDKKQLRMEMFYRVMRVRYDILMDEDGKPTGGLWNYDARNRSFPKRIVPPPRRAVHPPHPAVVEWVRTHLADHFGTVDAFRLACTRQEAEEEARFFMEHILPYFGAYQDVMLEGEPFVYHSLLSSYLNIGLLDPLALCRQAEERYRDGQASIEAVEGFIRQILGWREFIRGIYWLHMPTYKQRNALGASRTLPSLYWTGETEMNCMRHVVQDTKEHAYSHHIQRLMVTGNFALLAGVHPDEVTQWYWEVYSDAYEWVELPNTLGMALYADGGIVGSKPYAASGQYIDKMSNFCRTCPYNPKESLGEHACPFTTLFWYFLLQHEALLRGHPRMAVLYRHVDRMDRQAVCAKGEETLQRLGCAKREG